MTEPVETELFPAATGVFRGLASTLSGIRFVVLRPRSWPKAAIPAAVASALFLLLAGGGSAAAWRATAGLREGVPGYIVSVLLLVVSVAVAGVLALSLAQPASSFALDDLSRMREVSMGGAARVDDGAIWPTMWRSLRVTFAGLAVSVAAGLAATRAQLGDPAIGQAPRAFAVTATVALAGAWMGDTLLRFTRALWQAMPALVP
jgi:flagellar biosynthesis protein FliQ